VLIDNDVITSHACNFVLILTINIMRQLKDNFERKKDSCDMKSEEHVVAKRKTPSHIYHKCDEADY
jgi:hypothetical protein